MKKGHEPSRAELKKLHLELWLEPARLGLITSHWVTQQGVAANTLFLTENLSSQKSKQMSYLSHYCRDLVPNYLLTCSMETCKLLQEEIL